MSKTTTDRVTPDGMKLQAAIASLSKRPRVKAGVLGKEFDVPKDEKGNAPKQGRQAPATLGEVAVFNEFGAPMAGIPARSFIRDTADQYRTQWADMADRLRKKVMQGGLTIEQALGAMGEVILRDVRARMRAGIAPENAPATIAAKGSSTPLIDTGQLINALAWELMGQPGSDE